MRGETAVVRATVSVALLACGIAACGLDTSGLSAEASGTERDASAPFADSSVTGSSANGDTGANGGGSSSGGKGHPSGDDDGGDPDSGVLSVPDSAPFDACPLPVSNSGGVANATHPATAPIVDGDLSEWTCSDWISLTEGDAMYVKDAGPPVAAIFAAEYDDGHLYFAYHVTDANISGESPINPSVNDSVEVYLSGDSSPNGSYDTASHNYTVDHNNVDVDYGPTYQMPPLFQTQNPPNVTSAVKVVPGGYDVEVSVANVALAVASFAAGQTIFFDAQVNAGDGFNQNSVAVWALGKHGTCGCTNLNCCCGSATSDLPYCDSSRFGALVLK